MTKSETAYSPVTKPDTTFGAAVKVETAHSPTVKPETDFVGVFSDGVHYDEPTVSYDMMIINYDGKTKMSKHKDAFLNAIKNETAYA